MRKSLITVAVLGALTASSFVFAAEKETKSDSQRLAVLVYSVNTSFVD